MLKKIFTKVTFFVVFLQVFSPNFYTLLLNDKAIANAEDEIRISDLSTDKPEGIVERVVPVEETPVIEKGASVEVTIPEPITENVIDDSVVDVERPVEEGASVDAEKFFLDALVAGGDAWDPHDWTDGNPCQGGGGCYVEGDEIPVRISAEDLHPWHTYTIDLQIDYMNDEGVIGYESMDRNDPVRNDWGAFPISLTYLGTSDCNNDLCKNYRLTFTATSSDAYIYLDAILGEDSTHWSNGNGANLHFRLGGHGHQEIPVHAGEKHPKLTIIKEVTEGDANPNLWCFDITPAIDGQTHFCILDEENGGDGEDSVTIHDVPFVEESYTIIETDGDENYEFVGGYGENCPFDGNTAYPEMSEGSIEDSVESATCIFQNAEEETPPEPETGRIIVYKDVIDADGEDVFDDTEFSVNIGYEEDEPSSYPITDSEDPLYADTGDVETGTYTVEEILDNELYTYLGCGFIDGELSESLTFDLEDGEQVEIVCMNQQIEQEEPETPTLFIQKTNDAVGDLLPGTNVTYTITVTAGDTRVNDVYVVDILPKGFIFGGIWDSSILLPTDPIYSDKGIWYLGDMEPGDVVTLSYVAGISTTQQSGAYKDLAWTCGVDSDIPTAINSTCYTSNDAARVLGNIDTGYFVNTLVNVIRPVTDPANVVLAQTNQTLVITGQSAIYCAIAGLVLFIVSVGLFGKKKGVKMLVVPFMAFAFIFMPFMAGKVSAASSDIGVRLEQPHTPNNQSSFDLNFVALDIMNRDVTVDCYKKSSSDLDFVKFATASGNAGICTVDSSVLTSDGSYSFYVEALAGADVADSDVVTVEYDHVAPGTPVNYAKTQLDTCNYKLTFTTANDGGETKHVEIYRSQNTTFVADATTLVTTLNAGSNEAKEYTDTIPTCGQNYYYVLRATDDAGNVSAFVGDSVTNVTTTTVYVPANQPVAPANEGAVLGAETANGENTTANSSNSNNSDENGDVLSATTTSPNPQDSLTEDTGKASNGLVITASIIAFFGAAGTAAYLLLGRKKIR